MHKVQCFEDRDSARNQGYTYYSMSVQLDVDILEQESGVGSSGGELNGGSGGETSSLLWSSSNSYESGSGVFMLLVISKVQQYKSGFCPAVKALLVDMKLCCKVILHS